MKKQVLKKLSGIILGVITSISLVACSGSQTEKVEKSNTFKIGITKIVDHKALNDAEEGFKERWNEIADGTTFIEENAQGDVSNAIIISNNFVSENVDLILSIATPTSQATQKATEKNNIPVIFTAVSDPVGAGLVESLENPNTNITGVTDAVTEDSLKELFNLLLSIKKDVKAVGVIFNTGEINSLAQIETLEKILKEKNITLNKVGISEIASVDQAIEVISSNSDALILINDNMVASSIGLISEKATKHSLITISSDSSHVEEGAFLSLGISYKELGRQAADMAKEILLDGKKPQDIAVQNSNKLFKFVNKETADKLGIKININELSDAKIV